MVDEREIESDSSDYETESDDSEDERQRVALREMEERIGSIPERREEKLSKRKVSIRIIFGSPMVKRFWIDSERSSSSKTFYDPGL